MFVLSESQGKSHETINKLISLKSSATYGLQELFVWAFKTPDLFTLRLLEIYKSVSKTPQRDIYITEAIYQNIKKGNCQKI